MRVKSVFFVALAVVLTVFPAFSQDVDDSGDFYEDDEFLFFEDEEGLTVVGTPETTQQMETIEQEEIQALNAPDLASLLQDKLNIGFTRYGGRGNSGAINLRGFDSTRVALLVDGVPVNSAMNGEIDIDQIDLNSIERIEVIHGGSDSKYNVSGALGGVINIITVKQQNPGLRLGVSASNTASLPGLYYDRAERVQGPNLEDLVDAQNFGLDAAWGGDGFSFTANAFANRAANHFLFTDTYRRIRRKDNNEMWDSGASASFVWDFPSLTKVIASSNFFYSDKNIPTGGFSKFFGIQRDLSTRHGLLLDMPRAFHDDFATEASLVYTFSDRTYAPPAGSASRHDQHTVSAINRWAWYPADSLVLRSGVDYRFNYLDSTDIGDRTRHDGGLYVTVEWSPVDSLLITPSIKAVAASGETGGVMPVPKLGLLWNIGDTVTLKNNYFRSFKFPDFEDLYWSGGGAAGNPNLRPEDGWGGDLGIQWRFEDLFVLDSTFFAQSIKDSIHWASVGGTLKPENVGEAAYFGLDSKFRFDIPVSLGVVKTITASMSYQFMLSYLLSYGYGFESDKRIPYQPVHTAGASVEVPWDSGSAIISCHVESTRYADRANIDPLDTHVLLNATVNQNFGDNITVFASARNILNQSYESFAGYPMPGFSLTLGLKAKFGNQ